MTKKMFLPLMATVFIAGIMLFTSCEKEDSVTTQDQNIVKGLGEREHSDDIYYSTPENPNMLISLKDGRIEILRSVLLEDEIGNVQWPQRNVLFM